MSHGEEDHLAIVTPDNDGKDDNIGTVAFPFRLKRYVKLPKSTSRS